MFVLEYTYRIYTFNVSLHWTGFFPINWGCFSTVLLCRRSISLQTVSFKVLREIALHFWWPNTAAARVSNQVSCKQAAQIHTFGMPSGCWLSSGSQSVVVRAWSWADGVRGCQLHPWPGGPQRLSYTILEQPLFGAAGPRGLGCSCPALSPTKRGPDWLRSFYPVRGDSSSSPNSTSPLISSCCLLRRLCSFFYITCVKSVICVRISYAGHTPMKGRCVL